MTTSETTTSITNLAQQVAGKKTPIAIAVTEYIKSLLHGSPGTPYIFGQIQTTKTEVLNVVGQEVGSTSVQIPVATPANDGAFKKSAQNPILVAANDGAFKKVA